MGKDKGGNNAPSPGAPRDEMRNQVNYQNQRFESQQAPLVDTASYNYGRSSEADYGNYTDMMNNYRDLASGGGGRSGGDSGGGGGGGFSGSYNPYLVSPERVSAERAGQQTATNRSLGPLERVTAQQMNPMQRVQSQSVGPLQNVTAGKLGNNIERVTASDPFKSYGGYEEFSKTGGYSGQDIADMRARGVAPIRAAYANAERNMGQQRSLQGGYSPNAIAAQVKMAREQGQGMADASQNVDAGIAQARNAGRLAGLGGMSGIEGNRLNAQMQGDIFNAGQANQGRQFDISNQLGADQFNSGQYLQSRMNDVNNDFAGQQFNSNQAFQGNQFDIANRLNADQYNSGQAFQGQQFDIANDMNTSQFNAGQGNQIGMFNAGQANDVGKYNAGLNFQGQTYNADAQRAMQSQQNAAGESAAARSAAQNQYDTQTRLAALGGMQNLYGTTPGASQLFGNQAMGLVNSGVNQGIGMVNGTNMALNQPGQFDQTVDRIGQISNIVQNGANVYNAINQPRPTVTQQRIANNSLAGG